MAGRILTRQRQMAEQGRLRLGWIEPAANGKTKPVASKTWVITTHSEEHIKAAAALWGGTPERWKPQGHGAEQWRVITKTSAIDAILPPGEPLSQFYETWTAGGCSMRCDGATEVLSGSPCVCLAKFGIDWFERSAKEVCQNATRLKVLLPDMPGLGSWRMETGSHYAMDEVAGIVDTIKAAVGYETLVPVTLRIEPRTVTRDGQTKQFVVPVVEVRGATAGQILSGQSGIALNGASPRAAIEAAPGETPPTEAEWRKMIAAAPSVDVVRQVWELAKNTSGPSWVEQACKDRATEITTAGRPDVAADPSQDEDALWSQIVAASKFDTLDELEQDFAAKSGGIMPGSASAGELQAYLRLSQGAAA